MVLRTKEREEAIQLITMGPKVCDKLLTHHRRGYGVAVEALHDRIPLWQIAGKGPQMGSHGYKRLRWWKSGFVAPLDVFGGIRVYIGERIRSGGYEGPTRSGAAPSTLVASLRLL